MNYAEYSGQNLLQVEKILEKRTQKGGYTEYLVKWRNYEVTLVNDPVYK